MSNKIYPIGIQNFEKIRNGGYFYIDKSILSRQKGIICGIGYGKVGKGLE